MRDLSREQMQVLIVGMQSLSRVYCIQVRDSEITALRPIPFPAEARSPKSYNRLTALLYRILGATSMARPRLMSRRIFPAVSSLSALSLGLPQLLDVCAPRTPIRRDFVSLVGILLLSIHA